jgi:hypothetical protein
MADQRIQFNVRLDKYPALYEALKAKAQEEGLTFNDFAVRAFQQALGWEVEDNPPVRRSELEEMLAPMQRRLEEVEQRLGESRARA